MKKRLYDPQLGSGDKNRWVIWVVWGIAIFCLLIALLATNGYTTSPRPTQSVSPTVTEVPQQPTPFPTITPTAIPQIVFDTQYVVVDQKYLYSNLFVASDQRRYLPDGTLIYPTKISGRVYSLGWTCMSEWYVIENDKAVKRTSWDEGKLCVDFHGSKIGQWTYPLAQ